MFQACGCLPAFYPFSVSPDQGEGNTERCFQAGLWIQGSAIFVTYESSQHTPNIRWELLFIYRENKGHTNLLLFPMGRLHRKRKLPASRAQCISRTDIHMVSPNWFVVRLNTRTKRWNSGGIGNKSVEPQSHYYKHWTVVQGQLERYFPPSPKIHTSNKKAVQQFSKTQEQDASLVLQNKLSVFVRVVTAILHQKSAQALFLSLPYLIPVTIQGPLISLVVSDYIFFQTFNFSCFLCCCGSLNVFFFMLLQFSHNFPEHLQDSPSGLTQCEMRQTGIANKGLPLQGVGCWNQMFSKTSMGTKPFFFPLYTLIKPSCSFSEVTQIWIQKKVSKC